MQISVLRGSTATRVSTHDLVVGDIVMLSTGYKEKNLKIAYGSSVTIHPSIRQDPEMRTLAKEMILAQHVYFHGN